jgi:hypothetical protein
LKFVDKEDNEKQGNIPWRISKSGLWMLPAMKRTWDPTRYFPKLRVNSTFATYEFGTSRQQRLGGEGARAVIQ